MSKEESDLVNQFFTILFVGRPWLHQVCQILGCSAGQYRTANDVLRSHMVYLTIHSQASLTRWFTDRKYSCKSLHSNELQYNVFYNIALHYPILLYFTTTMYLCSLNIIAQHWTELHLTKRKEIQFSKFINYFTLFIYNYTDGYLLS